MRKLIYILTLLFLSFTFNSIPPPGWYQQTLPVNDFINDIFFLDSLNGWIVTDGAATINDTAYILRTTNGGDNWQIQNAKEEKLNSIQFLDLNNGYAAGGGNGTTFISFYKTTNGGINWQSINNINGLSIEDMYFINKDTGWVCDDTPIFVGGLYKTTNGGVSWVQQLNESYLPLQIFFINKDTGWVGANDPSKSIYKTTNGGTNWNTISAAGAPIRDIFFINKNTGWITRASNDKNGILKTTNGGYNWFIQTDPDSLGSAPQGIFFATTEIGYIATAWSKIIKTTDGGNLWGKQYVSSTGGYSTVYFLDTINGWASGAPRLIKTNDGGGPITYIKQVSKGIPDKFILYQNYPNPFNPKTIIKFNCKKTSDVSLKVYDIGGKLIDGVFYKNVHTGEYQYEFDGTELTSGVYFYRLSADGNVVETRKMVLLK